MDNRKPTLASGNGKKSWNLREDESGNTRLGGRGSEGFADQLRDAGSLCGRTRRHVVGSLNIVEWE